MKAFLLGMIALIVISVGAAFGLGVIDMSSKGVYTAPSSVRL